jgi:hypothetical protein
MHTKDQTQPRNLIQHYSIYLVGFMVRNYPPYNSTSSDIQRALQSTVNAHLHWDSIRM